jgi:hypothetical protein
MRTRGNWLVRRTRQRGDGRDGNDAGVEGAVMVKQVDSETIAEVLRIRHAVDSVGAPANIDAGETHPWVALLQGFAHQDVIDARVDALHTRVPRGVADGCNCFGSLARANAAFPKEERQLGTPQISEWTPVRVAVSSAREKAR